MTEMMASRRQHQRHKKLRIVRAVGGSLGIELTNPSSKETLKMGSPSFWQKISPGVWRFFRVAISAFLMGMTTIAVNPQIFASVDEAKRWTFLVIAAGLTGMLSAIWKLIRDTFPGFDKVPL